MIHTSITRNCVVFLLPRRQTRSAIYACEFVDSREWLTVLIRKVKGKPRTFESNVDHCILLLKYLSDHNMYLITNGYKRFSKTNSTDPRQRVPLNLPPIDFTARLQLNPNCSHQNHDPVKVL